MPKWNLTPEQDAALQAAFEGKPTSKCKTVYIKPLRTLVPIDERFADQIRDLLNAEPNITDEMIDRAIKAHEEPFGSGDAVGAMRDALTVVLQSTATNQGE